MNNKEVAIFDCLMKYKEQNTIMVKKMKIKNKSKENVNKEKGVKIFFHKKPLYWSRSSSSTSSGIRALQAMYISFILQCVCTEIFPDAD